MDIDELTLGQVKQLQSMVGCSTNQEHHPDIGKKVIIRTYSAGVHYGTLESKQGNECRLKDAIRIWNWYGACSLSQLAMDGTKEPDKCKFAVSIPSVTLQWIEIIPCSIAAQTSIEEVPSWKK